MSTVNFNDTTPAPPTGLTNIKWQSDASGNISAGVSPFATGTIVAADYTAAATDSYIVANTGVTTVTLPASPTPNQVLSIRNNATVAITINGNGHNVFGASTFSLPSGMSLCMTYNPAGAGTWVNFFYTSSAWLSWTPTVTATGSMTVSSVSILNAVYTRLTPSLIALQLYFTLTIGGTLSNGLQATLPSPTASGQVQVGTAILNQGQWVPCVSFIQGAAAPLLVTPSAGANYIAGATSVVASIIYQAQ